MRGEKLSKDLNDMTQLAVEKAAKRKEWLEKHFRQNDEPAVTEEFPI